MNQPLKLDLRARAGLLIYLVASQLLAKSVSGHWLTIENVVESERIWLPANGGDAGWFERVSISIWSQTLAERVDVKFPVMPGADSAATMFSESPRLDFRAPFVRAVYHMCLDHLAKMDWLMDGSLVQATAKHRKTGHSMLWPAFRLTACQRAAVDTGTISSSCASQLSGELRIPHPSAPVRPHPRICYQRLNARQSK